MRGRTIVLVLVVLGVVVLGVVFFRRRAQAAGPSIDGMPAQVPSTTGTNFPLRPGMSTTDIAKSLLTAGGTATCMAALKNPALCGAAGQLQTTVVFGAAPILYSGAKTTVNAVGSGAAKVWHAITPW